MNSLFNEILIKFLFVTCLLNTACFNFIESEEIEKEDKGGIVSLSGSSSPVYSMNPNKLIESSHWIEYHKQSNRLDSILGKCYECIRDKSYVEKKESTSDKGYRKNDNLAINNFGFPPFSLFNQVAFWLSGPVIHSSGVFVGNEPHRNLQTNSYETTSYTYNNYRKSNSFANSATCIVGLFGFDAYVSACEYGNSYCQISNIFAGLFGSCVPICVPVFQFDDVFNICSTGAISNKLGPICLTGDLSANSNGAVPVACNLNEECQVDLINQEGFCSSSCFKDLDTSCSSADYGSTTVRGPLCYVGTFGEDVNNNGAVLLGCGLGAFCVLSTGGGDVMGSCSSSCTETSTTKCFTQDFGNKLGPVCFVGKFGGNAKPVACLRGQYCQRSTTILPFGTTLSVGSCVSKCSSGANNYCCSSDLCNAFKSTINEVNCYNITYGDNYY